MIGQHVKVNSIDMEETAISDNDVEEILLPSTNPESEPEIIKDRCVRYFKLLQENGLYGGRFTAKIPKEAASKAFTNIIQKKNLNPSESNPMIITIIESSRGSDRKIFKFNAQRNRCDPPKKYLFKNPDGEIVERLYSYENCLEEII